MGDTADGGLLVTSPPFTGTGNSGLLANAVATNVKSTVASAIASAGGTSLYVRMDFTAANYASLSTLTLKMQYDAGYVAWLNGVQIASRNAPSSLAWNSLATEEQNSQLQATTYQTVDVTSFLNSATAGHLTATGNNVLAIQVLLASTTDTNLLVVPVLGQMASVVTPNDFTFTTPTPAAANALGNAEASITFSTVHGFFYAPFQLTLTPDIPGASIYYTTDNSVPSATNGTLYTGPINISTTMVLQAAMIVGGNCGPLPDRVLYLPCRRGQPAGQPERLPHDLERHDQRRER